MPELLRFGRGRECSLKCRFGDSGKSMPSGISSGDVFSSTWS
jgi:hypothetical protein